LIAECWGYDLVLNAWQSAVSGTFTARTHNGKRRLRHAHRIDIYGRRLLVYKRVALSSRVRFFGERSATRSCRQQKKVQILRPK
jgi:hypothetical protein